MRALALDPGGTTGYAIGSWYEPYNEMLLRVGELPFTLDELFKFIDDFISHAETNEAHIIYEDFQYRNVARAGLDLTPVKLIGIIELYRERFEPFVGFYKQTAATGKAFWSDDKLKAECIYARGRKHGRDATRHLMQWLSFGPGCQYVDVNNVNFILEIK